MSAPASTVRPAPPVPDDVLTRLPTPAYVYDLAEVRRNHGALVEALPDGAGLYYSLKANPHPSLLAVLRERGALPEVCSTGELAGRARGGLAGRGRPLHRSGQAGRGDRPRAAAGRADVLRGLPVRASASWTVWPAGPAPPRGVCCASTTTSRCRARA